MAREIAALIEPLSDMFGEGGGPDLSYSDQRAEIETPFQLDSNGDSVDERAWRSSIASIDLQCTETRDLWLAAYLARAGAKIGDLATVRDGVSLLAGLLEKLWPEVHPTLDEADFIGRRTPCDSLTKVREFLAPLGQVVLFEHRGGKVTADDLCRFAAEGASADGYAQFRGTIDSADAEHAAANRAAFDEAIAFIDTITTAIRRIDAVLVANAGSETGTNFTPTYERLDAIRAAIVPFATVDEASAAASIPADVGAAPMTASISGNVTSREDVVRAIDSVIDYYTAREPGSPVPVLLKRARHWVAMDFLEVLGDLVPESMEGARRVLVSKIDEPPGEGGFSNY